MEHKLFRRLKFYLKIFETNAFVRQNNKNVYSMDQVEEPLISTRNFYRPNSRFKRDIVILIFSLLLATCLTFYLFLNIQVYKSTESQEGDFKPLSRRKPILDHEYILKNSGPSLIAINNLLAHCIIALKLAGNEVVASSLLNKSKLDYISSKGKTREGVNDIVTGIDLKSSNIIANTIKDSYRLLKVVSEEDESQVSDNLVFSEDKNLLPIDRLDFAKLLYATKLEVEKNNQHHGNTLLPLNELLVWIDPLDATKEYSENLTQYVTLMGCIVHKQTPIAGIIHNPFTNKTYWSLKSQNGKYSSFSEDLHELLSNRVDKSAQDEHLKIIVSRSHAGDIEQSLKDIFSKGASIVKAGGSGFKTIELIKGSVDAYIHKTYIKKWDICAPQSLLNSINGAKMTTIEGKNIEFGDPKQSVVKEGLIATLKSDIHSNLLKQMKNFKNL